jgi:hypothetical protein
MVSRFFHRPSRSLKHHTVSLLPEVEAIIQTCTAKAVEHITRRTGDPTNFSISTNMIILGRLTSALTEQRKGRGPDPDAVEWLMDLIDRKRHVTDRELREYEEFVTLLYGEYCKRH